METRVIPVIHEIYQRRHTRHELVPDDICARRSRICHKLVLYTKTRCNEDQMRNSTGNLDKEAKGPYQRPASTRCSSNQLWNKADLSWQSRPLERGAKRLLTIASFSRFWLSLSAPVENFSWPDLTGLSSVAPTHKYVAKKWMHMNIELELYVMKINSQGYPRSPLSWKLSSAPYFQRSPHQLQILIQTVQWNLAGDTLDDQQALQMNHTLKHNNLLMPSSRYSAHGYKWFEIITQWSICKVYHEKLKQSEDEIIEKFKWGKAKNIKNPI